MSSRKLEDLHPELVRRWLEAREEFSQTYPELPQPFITQTYRSFDEQEYLYKKGRSLPGLRVTNARGGQSLHNYMPSLAFDISFLETHKDPKVRWDAHLFVKFAKIAKAKGLAWGGDWQGFQDLPHFYPPGFEWRDASAGKVPVFV